MTKFLFGLVGALGAMSLAGCGGGGGSSSGATDVPITRELLAGTGISKTWIVNSIQGNGNYPGGGAERPCPATLNSTVDASKTLQCGDPDFVIFSVDGTLRYDGVDGTWTLSGDTATFDFGAAGKKTLRMTGKIDHGFLFLRIEQTGLTKGGVPDAFDNGTAAILNDVS